MKFGLRYASLGSYSNGPAAVELAQAAEAAGLRLDLDGRARGRARRSTSRSYPYSPSGRMGSGSRTSRSPIR